MTMEREDVLRKVAAMMRQAEDDSVTEAEATAFAAKATAMCLQHSIDLIEVARVNADDQSTRISAEAVELVMDVGTGRTATWDAHLAWAVGHAMGARVIRTPGYGAKSRPNTYNPGKMTIISVGSADAIIEVISYLRLVGDLHSGQAMRDREPVRTYNYRTGEYEMKKRGGRAYRLAWLAGYTNRVGERLEEVYRETEAESPGNALVLVRDLVYEKVKEMFPRLSMARTQRKAYNPAAYAAGAAHAEKVDIGLAKLGNSQGLLGAG